ncbi:MAG: hypothetical protein P8P74_09030 [Crocinitomicaceae bacterium]|nr:hypothetical protein [Crocinitomicaceae bacterium]
MPIDQAILGPMMGPYENMINDVDSQGISNEHVDEMKSCFARMTDLALEHSDITAFMGICMQEDLFGKFSNQYGQALTAGAEESTASRSNYDDAALLKQTVNALRQSISAIKQGQKDALAEASKSDSVAEVESLDQTADIIQPIEDLIALGEQGGITYADFLRMQIEQGLDKAMEGSVATRKGLVFSLGWAEAGKISPHHIAKCKKHLSVFDDLSSKQKFGVPNSKELQWAMIDVDYEFELDIIKWGEITSRWNTILDNLHEWSLAYCSHAPFVDPWRMLQEPQKSRSIQKSKDCLPGMIKQRERLLEKYFGITFQDIFTHETFLWAIETNTIHYSKEFIDFLKHKVYPTCIPLQQMPQEFIAEREQLSKDKREVNPKIMEPAKRMRTHYDSKFGEGRYTTKYGELDTIESNAIPWG